MPCFNKKKKHCFEKLQCCWRKSLLICIYFLSDSILVESGKTRNVLDDKGDDPVVGVEMVAEKQTVSVEVISSKELAAVSVNGKNVS